MQFQFKIQEFQTRAVRAVEDVFAGQPTTDTPEFYSRMAGGGLPFADQTLGYRNAGVRLDADSLLTNVRQVQRREGILLSEHLSQPEGLGACALDVEMETGTGKTYVYIATMHQLMSSYGWSKYIVVVPSVAIREGVRKSFSLLEEHFMELYGRKPRVFVYDSERLQLIDAFASDSGLNVMIINAQAFNSSFSEANAQGGRKGNESARIIFSERDEFQSRRPIEVLAACRPIVVLDEPQKLEGEATQAALRQFDPLFTLYYSATHRTVHNTVYALDALDAYQQRLVKCIQVKGFELRALLGTAGYLYVEEIRVSPDAPPTAKIEIEVRGSNGKIRRVGRRFVTGDSLREAAGGLLQYEGYDVADIDPSTSSVLFQNGRRLRTGELQGDTSEKTLQRLQIRETIASHFEKEEQLYSLGVKCLSLFFIDTVGHYKCYDGKGQEQPGFLWQMFEEEYKSYVEAHSAQFSPEYRRYICRFTPRQLHRGYFSVDRKNGRAVDSTVKRGESSAEDVSAYDLILKEKERLLSLEEPVRFIFSHSALREEWDNPNVFQICTLRHAQSSIAKHQEVGRGLRLCVNERGERMDAERLGRAVHDINCLTVIANESYRSFVTGLQHDVDQQLRPRPSRVDTAFFTTLEVDTPRGRRAVTADEAQAIASYLWANDYVADGRVTEAYLEAVDNGTLAPLPEKLASLADAVHTAIAKSYQENYAQLEVEDGLAAKIPANRLNANFYKKEFQQLWSLINRKWVYTVHYSSEELIANSIAAVDQGLAVGSPNWGMAVGRQGESATFIPERTATHALVPVLASVVRYDLVGEVARGTSLTRSSAAKILRGLAPETFAKFQENPEQFIAGVVALIREQKAAMIIEHITYSELEEQYDSTIFTAGEHRNFARAMLTKKHISDYLYTDGQAAESVERRFAEELELAVEVSVYAKLPRAFQIPTPMGSYTPDWAIVLREGNERHIYFVAETKGSLETLSLCGIEKVKVDCARRLFESLRKGKVRYRQVASYADLVNALGSE